MYKYQVTAKPAKKNGGSFNAPGIPELLERGKIYFNQNSLTASNSKQIQKIEIQDDSTIVIFFWSEKKLQRSQASRSLRIFSSYLRDEDQKPNLSGMVSGSTLFKMFVREINEENNTKILEKNKENSELSHPMEWEDILLLKIIRIFTNKDKNQKIIKKISEIVEEEIC